MKMLMLAGRGNERGRDHGSEPRQNYGDSNYGRMGYDGAQGNYVRPEGNYSGRNNRSNYTRNEYEHEMRDMDARFRGGERSNYPDYERRTQMTYPIEDNYGESRRRFPRREDGTFAPRSEMDEMESRRRRDRMGRFTSEMDEVGMHYPYTPYVPPIYEREGDGRMNVIGFERGNEMPSNYGMRAEHKHMDEMKQHGGQMQMGRGTHETKLTKEMAEEWMMGLQNEDGTKGPHWSMDQAKQVMQQRGIQSDPVTFWAILNMMYSDYCKVFKKHGVGDRVDFYSDMVAAFLNDKDGPEPAKKAAAYYEYIVNQ